MKYQQVYDGDWVPVPRRTKNKIACCDCGLVHDITFRVRRGLLWYQVARNNRSTALIRRHRGIRIPKRVNSR